MLKLWWELLIWGKLIIYNLYFKYSHGNVKTKISKWDFCWLMDCHATFEWLNRRIWRCTFLNCTKETTEVSASKLTLTTQDKIDVAFSIKDGKYKCAQVTWDHKSNDQRALYMKNSIITFLVGVTGNVSSSEIVDLNIISCLFLAYSWKQYNACKLNYVIVFNFNGMQSVDFQFDNKTQLLLLPLVLRWY